MDAVNAAMRGFFGLVWAPFDGIPHWIGLLVLGVAFGVVALIAMKYTTNPKRVERFKGKYQGHILAIKLFRDSFVVVITSLVKTLGWVGCYLGEQFKPMFVMLVPFMLLFAQLELRLGMAPVKVGEKVLLSVDMTVAAPADLPVTVALPAGVELAGKVMHEPSRHRVVVPLIAKSDGVFQVKLTCGSETVEKSLHAGAIAGAPMVSPVRSNGFWDQILYPGEPAFGTASLFEKIELHYPVRVLDCFGLDLGFGSEMGMMLVFVGITIVAAFGLKGVFGVTI